MTGRVLSLLMVEDTPAEADLIKALLAEARETTFSVTHADRLALGLEHLRHHPVDVVLLDFSLPDSSGMASFRKIREISPDVPVVILTGLEDDEVAVQAVREGAQDYLSKRTVDTPLLTRAIRYAIERQRAEVALRRSEERFAVAVRGANDGIWDWDISADTVYYSDRWREMLGVGPEERTDSLAAWLERVHPGDRGTFQAAFMAHLDGRTEDFSQEHRIRGADRQWIWVLSRGRAFRDASGRAVRMAGSMSDVTARKQAEDRLLHEALHDALTGLPNRILFMDRLEQALERQRREPALVCAVLFLDLDRFKVVNDCHGHAAGDELLVAIAHRLSGLLRRGDTLARLSGDEFAILLPDHRDSRSALQVAERVRRELDRSFEVRGQELYTTASLGIAVAKAGDQAEDVVRDADIAMYRAKAGGGARAAVFNRAMHEKAVAAMQMETDLRRAVERNEFELHYQPVISLGSGRITGMEALIRWRRPDGTLVPPGAFIPLAEETGLVVPMGWWVLKEACRQLKDWQGRFPAYRELSVGVNVSGRMFAHEDMVDHVVAALEENALDASSLKLEITENVVLDHGHTVVARLASLRRIGVELHVDDFGTGYSSLAYLQRFRYDALKIDRSFVADLERGGEGAAIVDALLALAHHLRMAVVAEGVETEAQARKLRSLRCPYVQGYWFSRPLPAAAMEALLAQDPRWDVQPERAVLTATDSGIESWADAEATMDPERRGHSPDLWVEEPTSPDLQA